MHRPRDWDTVASVGAELPGNEAHFTALPDGTLLAEEDVPDGSLPSLAEAIEASVQPPYRAEAVRRSEGIWAVAARRSQVIEVAEDDSTARATLTVTPASATLVEDSQAPSAACRRSSG